MNIEIKRFILEEGILANIAEMGKNPFNAPDSSSKMNHRSEKFMTLSPEELQAKASKFKKEEGLMALDKNKRDFITGHASGTQAGAQDLFQAKRTQQLNGGL